MFDMTNDSGLFRTRKELEEQERAWPVGGNRFRTGTCDWLPLYVGRMIHQFDHRAASVEVNPDNVHNAALSGDITPSRKADPTFSPEPQYWVPATSIEWPEDLGWILAFRDIARTTDARTAIAAAGPPAGYGNTLPILKPEDTEIFKEYAPCLLANMNAIILDYIARQKVQSTHLNWYIIEQLPVVPPSMYDDVTFGDRTAADVVREIVLELTYTAHDMAAFARDFGYVDESGEVRPPFAWDPDRRLRLQAKLDAVFFHLYGITDRDDIRYIYSTFPIVEREETATYGHYHSRDLCLAYMNALGAGQPNAEPAVMAG
jgi:hypothetical protein